MELIRGIANLRPKHRGSVSTIGAFDGIHLGHRAVLQRLIEKGRELGLPTAVVVFEPLPREYLSPAEAPGRLMSFRERYQAMAALGVDRIMRIRFTESLREMDAEDFINQIFVDGLGSKHIIVGDDMRFGKNRAGDFELLEAFGQRQGFTVEATDTLTVLGERVSSTRIRQALAECKLDLAETLLGRPYSVSGKVIVGQQLGRTLGAPTANVALHRLRAPLSGVFNVDVVVDGDTVHGIANVGTRPTVGDGLKAILEVHLLDFNRDIYGQNIEVVFRAKIRDEIKFDSFDRLKQQIHKDIETGRKFFASAHQ